ncbi:hypothetical protein DEO72_LG1g3124 [Vigna unguiculata]|uniref:Uncharacterized protein n=1 Tax=Vigna unguiculata TaxID=3917 RepID=A0A4D6KPK0_VIGUN|nr:hypothetical protein DEO72_LG1g3124 [Vigna unguiculata]
MESDDPNVSRWPDNTNRTARHNDAHQLGKPNNLNMSGWPDDLDVTGKLDHLLGAQ